MLLPAVKVLGIDLVHFGVLVVLNMMIGLIHPPFGMLLFTMKSVAPRQISMQQVFGAVTPYVLFSLLMLAAVMAFPPLATWLPQVLFAP